MQKKAAVLLSILLLAGCGPSYLELMKQDYRQAMAKATTTEEKAIIQKDYEIKLKEYEIELLQQNNMLLLHRALVSPEPRVIIRR